jgi:phosphoribosylanthranilate isomerase
MRTWIKFCGTTSLADAEASAAAGADAVGFVFTASKRQVTAAQVQGITRHLPREIEKIGVFCDETMENILATVKLAGLTGVQLHGKEPAGDVERLAEERRDDERFRVTKTVLIQGDFSDELRRVLSTVRPPHRVLLDSGAGSGKTFAWDTVREVVRSSQAHVIVAGGLTPGNVGEAIKTFLPWGVDLASGVEIQPGKKDPQKLRAFVEAVRKAETNNG